MSAAHKVSQDYLEIFIKLHEKGISYAEISRRFGFAVSTVKSCIKRYKENAIPK